MLDLSILQDAQTPWLDLAARLTVADLRDLTNQMIDRQLALIAGCDDSSVVFVPDDPDAHDRYAVNPDEERIAWTLGHVIVHVTATSEESAFLATEMARGVQRDGRSRYETPWPTVTTIAQCRARLEESRRMRLALLNAWPDPPHLEITFIHRRLPEPINAVGRFLMGLMHDADHLGQIEGIVGQWTMLR
jgi:hypothetical protein